MTYACREDVAVFHKQTVLSAKGGPRMMMAAVPLPEAVSSKQPAAWQPAGTPRLPPCPPPPPGGKHPHLCGLCLHRLRTCGWQLLDPS